MLEGWDGLRGSIATRMTDLQLYVLFTWNYDFESNAKENNVVHLFITRAHRFTASRFIYKRSFLRGDKVFPSTKEDLKGGKHFTARLVDQSGNAEL